MSMSNDQPTAAGVDGRRLQANDVNFFAGQAMTLRFHISAARRFARACDARSLYAAGVCLKHFGPPHWAVNAKERTTQQHRTSRSANAYVCMWSACDERERAAVRALPLSRIGERSEQNNKYLKIKSSVI